MTKRLQPHQLLCLVVFEDCLKEVNVATVTHTHWYVDYCFEAWHFGRRHFFLFFFFFVGASGFASAGHYK